MEDTTLQNKPQKTYLPDQTLNLNPITGSGYDNIRENLLGFYAQKYGIMPSINYIGNYKIKNFNKSITDLGYTLVGKSHICLKKEDTPYYEFYIDEATKSFVWCDHNIDSKILDVCIIYPINEKPDLSSIKPYIRRRKSKEKTYNIGLLLPTQTGGLAVRYFDLDYEPVDLGNYCAPVREDYKDMIKSLEKNKKGLYLFTGEPGTGKTTLLKKLAHDMEKSDKSFIFISADNAELLGNPHLIETLMHERGSILVIEDGESSIAKRDIDFTHRTKFTSNLLNITDGLMSDVLQTQVIITLNCSDEHIDPAFLRHGRLKKRYCFESLSPEEANDWCIKNRLGEEIYDNIKLSDLYEKLENQKDEATKSSIPRKK